MTREPSVRRVTDRGRQAPGLLTDLAAATGRTWSVRRRVWAVEAPEDGRAPAALDGVRAESWLPSGERQWAAPDEPHRDKWVVAVGADGTPRRLFPPSWDAPQGHLPDGTVDGRVLERDASPGRRRDAS
ncbi:hypothetical protein ABZW32_31260 [Streptomyces sp. NPDC004667]|uniref:hypothetical protein n=1 Tax=Streptomyces sp. NPDC004667 TaxID=3154285 RepID=UPI0033A2D75B